MDSLRARVGTKSMEVYPVDYPATTDFPTAMDGIRDASAHIESTATNCPNTNMVLGGFSQGAAVMGFVTANVIPDGAPEGVPNPMPPDVADHVAAVALLGKPNDRFMRAINQPSITVGPLYADKTIDLCVPDDLVCSSGRDFNAHMQYMETGMVDQAATFTATRLSARSAPIAPQAPAPAAPPQAHAPAGAASAWTCRAAASACTCRAAASAYACPAGIPCSCWNTATATSTACSGDVVLVYDRMSCSRTRLTRCGARLRRHDLDADDRPYRPAYTGTAAKQTASSPCAPATATNPAASNPETPPKTNPRCKQCPETSVYGVSKRWIATRPSAPRPKSLTPAQPTSWAGASR